MRGGGPRRQDERDARGDFMHERGHCEAASPSLSFEIFSEGQEPPRIPRARLPFFEVAMERGVYGAAAAARNGCPNVAGPPTPRA